jgi:hypothetical protein
MVSFATFRASLAVLFRLVVVRFETLIAGSVFENHGVMFWFRPFVFGNVDDSRIASVDDGEGNTLLISLT